MAGKILKGAVVGASSLLGKELADELNGSSAAVWDLKLLDAGDTGTISSAGDEALVVQEVSAEGFSGVDVAFFAGDPAVAREHWKTAQDAGASLVDLTAALERVPGFVVRSPWVSAGAKSDLATMGIVSANPAAVMLAVVAERLSAAFGAVTMAATVMEPASQHDAAGLDELHQQTVGLLSFSAVPKDIYDAQVAFALRSSLGGAAKIDLSATADTIRRHFTTISGGATIALQLIQAPVFHGYTASVFVQAGAEVGEEAVRKALHGGLVEAEDPGDEAPSNDSVAGKSEIFVDVKMELNADGFWLWIVVDNLRLAASHAAACAAELIALRPADGVH